MNKYKKGFTIVEAVVYFALTSTFLVLITDILLSTLETESESESYVSVAQDGRFLLSKISNELRSAKYLLWPCQSGEKVYQEDGTTINNVAGYYTGYSGSGNCVVTTTPHSVTCANDGTICLDYVVPVAPFGPTNYERRQIRLHNNIIKEGTVLGTATALNSGDSRVTSLQFTRYTIPNCDSPPCDGSALDKKNKSKDVVDISLTVESTIVKKTGDTEQYSKTFTTSVALR